VNVNVPVIIEKQATTIKCELAVQYGEEDIPNNFPGRNGDLLTIVLDLNTKKVRDWPADYGEAGCHMKVCDQGTYTLIDDVGEEIVRIENDYVPSCIPQQYGDYVEFDIAPDGTLIGWEPNAREVEECFWV
jgi:hypothetical protein